MASSHSPERRNENAWHDPCVQLQFLSDARNWLNCGALVDRKRHVFLHSRLIFCRLFATRVYKLMPFGSSAFTVLSLIGQLLLGSIRCRPCSATTNGYKYFSIRIDEITFLPIAIQAFDARNDSTSSWAILKVHFYLWCAYHWCIGNKSNVTHRQNS